MWDRRGSDIKYNETHKEEIRVRAKKRREERKEELKEYDRKYREEHREEINRRAREYYSEHKEESRELGRKTYARLKEKGNTSRRDRHLVSKYSITQEDYNSLFVAQEGRCAICGKHQSEVSRTLAVDHDHETGEIRGLLCHSCNVVLGLMADDPGTLRSAADYLERGIRG